MSRLIEFDLTGSAETTFELSFAAFGLDLDLRTAHFGNIDFDADGYLFPNQFGTGVFRFYDEENDGFLPPSLTQTENGIGVVNQYRDIGEQIDGDGSDEVVFFSFSQPVTVKSVSLIQEANRFDLDATGVQTFRVFTGEETLDTISRNTVVDQTADNQLDLETDFFGIGAQQHFDSFRVAGITVELIEAGSSTTTADAFEMAANAAPLVLDVLANDASLDGITALEATSLLGTLEIASDGQTLTYTPAAEFLDLVGDATVTETFRYVATDDEGGQFIETATVTIGASQEPEIIVQPGAIKGYYFVDTDMDGREDANSGLAGQTINLMQGNTVLATTQTGADGRYFFDTLDAGGYYLTVGIDAEAYSFTGGNRGGDDAIDSDIWGTNSAGLGVSAYIVLGEDEIIEDVDIGVVQNMTEEEEQNMHSGVIEGIYFIDTNADGQQDSGAGVGGQDINLMQGSRVVATTQTAEDGSYSFENVADGGYFLNVEINTDDFVFTTANRGDDATDSDIWGTNSAGLGVSAYVILDDAMPQAQLDIGVEALNPSDPVEDPTDPEPTQFGTIEGIYFIDADGDGQQDDGGTVAGQTINLLSGNRIIATQTTDANGAYSFDDLAEGGYFLHVGIDDNQFEFTAANRGNDASDSDIWGVNDDGLGMSAYVRLAQGEVFDTLDIGVVALPLGEIFDDLA